MADKRSQMLPASRPEPFVMPSLDMKTSGQRLYERNHADQTNRAFADAMVVNFPQNPSLLQRRNDYAQILTGQGLPIEQAMAEAEAAIPDAAPVQPPAGSQLPPITAPHELGRGADTTMLHVRPDEIPAIQKALDFPGTVNPHTGYLEFGGGGGTINGKGGSGNVSGGGRGNASGGGYGNTGKGEQSRVNDRPGTQQRSWGNRTETSYGAPEHTNALGVTVAQSPASWANMNEQVNTYNQAADRWNRSAFDRSFENFVNNMEPMGFSMQAPQYSRPKTYVGGDYHLGVNPAKLAGSILGPYGSSIALGPIAGKLYTEMGGNNVMLGGGEVPAGWRGGVDGGAGIPGDHPGAGPGAGSGPNSPGRGDAGGTALLPPIVSTPGGANLGQSPTSGSLLPPITAPTGGTNPAAYMPISGPTPYGWQRPAWARTY